MTDQCKPGRLRTAAGALLCATSTLYAQSTVDPWSRVIALPTACYYKKYEYTARSNEAGMVVIPPAEAAAVEREADRAYQGICAQWCGAAGSMQAFMKSYKDYLVTERIPKEEQLDRQKLANFAMTNTPAKSYRSVAMLNAAQDYMELAARLYHLRPPAAICTAAKCNDVANF